jgi:hypothetical protein
MTEQEIRAGYASLPNIPYNEQTIEQHRFEEKLHCAETINSIIELYPSFYTAEDILDMEYEHYLNYLCLRDSWKMLGRECIVKLIKEQLKDRIVKR